MTTATAAAIPTAALPSETRFFPSHEVRQALGRRADKLKEIARAAIESAGRGAELWFLDFTADGRRFALASRIDKTKGTLDIEIGFIGSTLTSRCITLAEHRACEARRRAQA